MPSLEKLYQTFSSQAFTVVAIAIENNDDGKVNAFQKKLKLHFPILVDPQQQVSQTYGVSDLPSTFLLNPEGKVIAAAKGERDWFSKEARSYIKELITQQSNQ